MINKILHGNSLDVIKTIPDNHVDCIVTSPPYYGLRDYQTGVWKGGNESCNHYRDNKITENCGTGQKSITSGNGDSIYKDVCKKCGAIRIDNQIGLEQTPQEYVQKLVTLFRECRRILKQEGTLWLNLGDSYCRTGGKGSLTDPKYSEGRNGQEKAVNRVVNGLKPKNLLGIPWRVAFALQDDGWILRQDIIWSKPNPMPESVTDRCTKSHEYIFLFAKKPKYFYDNEAIKENSVDEESYTGIRKRNIPKINLIDPSHGYFKNIKKNTGKTYPKRNKRTVWTVNTHSYKEAHFATFPVKLIEPCILAGCTKEGIVFDPFMGAGTTAVASVINNRNYLGIELNKEYIKLAEKRIEKHKRHLEQRLF